MAQATLQKVLENRDLLTEILRHGKTRNVGAMSLVNKDWHKASEP